MNPRSSSASYGVRSLASTLLICRYRLGSGSILTPGHQNMRSSAIPSKLGHDIGSSMQQTMSISSGDSKERPESKIEEKDTFTVQPPDPTPSRLNIFSWVKWVFGSIMPVMFLFWKQKWDKLLKLEGKVNEVVNEAEEVAEVVEKVAMTAEKLSAEFAEKLDNGELKEVALMVEHVSSVTAKDARMTQDFIHKVGDLKKDLTELETMVEPVIDEIKQKK